MRCLAVRCPPPRVPFPHHRLVRRRLTGQRVRYGADTLDVVQAAFGDQAVVVVVTDSETTLAPPSRAWTLAWASDTRSFAPTETSKPLPAAVDVTPAALIEQIERMPGVQVDRARGTATLGDGVVLDLQAPESRLFYELALVQQVLAWRRAEADLPAAAPDALVFEVSGLEVRGGRTLEPWSRSCRWC